MATKNLGQVSGVYIGNTPPNNIILIWYDNTPSQMIHKVYNPALSQWVVLDQNVISSITYSELVNIATNVGLTVGQWFKITDKSNSLALSITSTKVQYIDSLGNILIDDLGSNVQYHVTSSNLLIDDLSGVFDSVNKKLVFQFNEQIPDYTADDYIFGKVKRNNIWSLAKYKLSSFLSKVTGNSITWNGGFFFNFGDSIRNVLDESGGVVAKDTYDTDKQTLTTAINNVGQQNQTIIQNANQSISDATTPTAIYNKALPNDLEIGGAAVNLSKGDTFNTLFSKIQRWINQLKLATGIRISSAFIDANTQQYINSNDTVETAFGKVQFWFKNISLKLSSTFAPYPYSDIIPDLAPDDTLEEAFKKVQGKLNQIGTLSDGKIQSKAIVQDSSVPVTTLDLKNGNASFYYPYDVNKRCVIDSTETSFSSRDGNFISKISKNGVFSNAAKESIYSSALGIDHAVSVAGLGYGNVAKDEYLDTSFLAGVAGVASNSNSNPAPSFGGYFDKLMVNGLYLKIKQITSNYNMLSTDVCLSCYNVAVITITLPVSPYKGQTVYITQMNASGITINSGSSNIFYQGSFTGTSSTTTTSTERSNTFKLTWDGQFWLLNQISW